MYYSKVGVQCTSNGLPICHLDDKTCDVEGCRYYVSLEEFGNCILRIDKSCCYTMRKIASILGITPQRVDQIEKNAMRKLNKWHGADLRETLRDIGRSERR